VQSDRRDVVSQDLERHRMVARRELQFVQADALTLLRDA
jgi:hypothetical protein